MTGTSTLSDLSLLATPAIPTDTNGILLRLLQLSAESHASAESSDTQPLISRTLLSRLVSGLKIRDSQLLRHGRRIATIASGVAEMLGYTRDQRHVLEVAALLHDLGKIAVPEHILKKPGGLSPDEYDYVLMHHYAAVSLLQASGADTNLVMTLRMLYDDFNGAGVSTSAGSSDELPLGPRILAVADAYDSLCTPQSFRSGMSHAEAIAILQEGAGQRYDGNVVAALGRWYDASGASLFQMSDPFSRVDDEMPTEEELRQLSVVVQTVSLFYQFETLSDGFIILDAQRRYVVCSSGMSRFGSDPELMQCGQRWEPHHIPFRIRRSRSADSEIIDEALSASIRTLNDGRARCDAVLFGNDDSSLAGIDLHTMPIQSANGEILGVVQLLKYRTGINTRRREYEELQLAATMDPLTGVANRGQLETQLRHLLDEFHDSEGADRLSVVFLDVDHFKSINDTFNHRTGDQVLIDVSGLLQHETYSGELIGRYGGEEFVLVCPDTDEETAVRRAERIRRAIEKSPVGGVSRLKVTVSMGVASTVLGDTVQTLLERADTALFKAKRTGRNKTCWPTCACSEDGSAMKGNAVAECEAGQITLKDDRLQLETSLQIASAPEITRIKLGAFVDEAKARIIEANEEHVVCQIGESGFLKRWGKEPERQPVQIKMTMTTTKPSRDGGSVVRGRRFIEVLISSLGRTPDHEQFGKRATWLVRTLRSYLLSE